MAEPVRHRQTKGAATDMFDLQPPRHTSTLPDSAVGSRASMSAKGRKADIWERPGEVAEVPEADSCTAPDPLGWSYAAESIEPRYWWILRQLWSEHIPF